MLRRYACRFGALCDQRFDQFEPLKPLTTEATLLKFGGRFCKLQHNRQGTWS
jgi:hypothetical protein